jgi:CubicO group peptidase (beta-lactamase class C family)
MTVGDLSSMASGLDWDESYYSPFSITTRAYFDEHLDQVILSQKGIEDPGKSYKYLSGNTQLLAMVIEKATEKVWPITSRKISGNPWAQKTCTLQTDRKDGVVSVLLYCQ